MHIPYLIKGKCKNNFGFHTDKERFTLFHLALIETVVLERTDWPIVEWLTPDWADLDERVVIEVPTRREDFFELCWTANI